LLHPLTGTLLVGDAVAKLSEPPIQNRQFEGLERLNESDRRLVQRWQRDARVACVDGVEELTARHWPGVFAGVVLGVFVHDDDTAMWIVVGRDGLWCVVSCVDGSVSRPVASLEEALSVVHPIETLSEWS
jgi:hypothetical protein